MLTHTEIVTLKLEDRFTPLVQAMKDLLETTPAPAAAIAPDWHAFARVETIVARGSVTCVLMPTPEFFRWCGDVCVGATHLLHSNKERQR